LYFITFFSFCILYSFFYFSIPFLFIPLFSSTSSASSTSSSSSSSSSTSSWFFCGRWFGVVALQAGHGDSSYGHDGLPVSGAESYLESYNSLTINLGPLLLLGGTIFKKKYKNKKWNKETNEKREKIDYNKQKKSERRERKMKEVLIPFSLSIEKLITGSPRSMIWWWWK